MRSLAGVPHHRPYGRLAAGAVAALVVIVVSWAMDATPVLAWEERAFRVVNDAPALFWPVLWPVMQLGTFAAPLVCAGAVAVVWRRRRPALALALGGYGAWTAAQVIKETVGRARPDALLADVVLREGAEGMGFVSGHTAVATALVTVAWPYLGPRAQVVGVVLAALVGVARIYAGVHLPLDVIGGPAIGVLLGVVAGAVLGLPHRTAAGTSDA